MAHEIPTWLDCPPVGNVPSPPVETRAQGLPFNELTWQNFERLILRLVRRESSVLDCEIYGTPGQAQEGIDVLAIPEAEPTKRICYQCKKVEEFDPSDIRNAVDAFLNGRWAEQAKEFVLCVARPLESTTQVAEISAQRERLHGSGISFVIWDSSDAGRLCEKLKLQPSLVDDFFGRSWVNAFNGADAAASLGQRLDAVDLGQLRIRLKALYTVLFNQHDPGLRTTSGHVADYLHRYVLADVVEVSKMTPSRVEQAPGSTPAPSNGEPLSLQSVATATASIYESRRGVMGWIKDQQNCVVLGEAGYGKSAMLRHLALALLRQDDALAGQLEPTQLRRLPVWMSFAAFAAAIERKPDTSVEDHFREWLHQNSFDDVQALFERSLRSSEVLLLVDGLDEATTQVQAHHALDRIVSFAQATSAVVICTSRPRGFNSLGVPATWANANLAALSDEQICELSARWFALTEDDVSTDEYFDDARRRAQGRAEAFLAAVRANARTHQLARIPLLCQTLIELFRASHRLPEEREAIYGEIITLLLSRHPDARARAAGAPISLDSLGIGLRDIREMLIRLAWAMQSNGRVVVASADQLEAVCVVYLEDDVDGLGLPKPEARRRAQAIIAALVSRFGLLVEKAPQELGFVHLSIQEFLAAESVSRKTEAEQLEWIADTWMQPVWRECVVNWFGIQGARGKKGFAGQAATRIAELGRAGEFERMQALELRAELACADIGLPINEARKVIHEAAEDLEKSPFLHHRVVLATSLTIGALGSGVRDECSALIRKWTPGRPSYSRAAVLSALEGWGPADDLQSTLLQGMRDEEFVCRRAAAQTIAKVFVQSNDLPSILVRMALHEVRPEVRASALRALGLQAAWAEQALACANTNLSTACAELILEAVKVRVKQRQHDAEDLQRMSRLWSTEAIDYWQRAEFYDVLFEGWAEAQTVREAFLAPIRDGNRSRMGDDEQLIYLIRAYPGDNEIAELISRKLRNHGMHFSMDKSVLWPIMRDSFRGHPLLVPALREALAEYRKQFQAIFWHPDTVGAYWVIGDDAARDELLAAYSIEKDANGKSWIARTLFDGWQNDEKVRQALNTWAQSPNEFAAPLACLSRSLFDNVDERRSWLEKLSREGDARTVPQALLEILDQFPDERGLELVRDRLKNVKMWYYNTIQLESKVAACAPTESSSQAIFERSLSELDGPPVSSWAASVENLPAFRSRVLVAAVPAPVEVRMAIATTLRERMADYDNLMRLVPEYIAEENGAVRATTLLALAQTTRGHDSNRAAMCEILTSELMSSGSYYESRRRAALAGLLELGAGALAAEALEKSKLTHWTGLLVDSLHPDPISLNTVVRHWNVLRPLLEARGLPTDMPINEIVSAGYGTVFEQSPELKMDLDEYLRGPLPDWAVASFFELLARRYPRSDFLRSTLIQALEHSQRNNQIGRTIMRLLAHHFRADQPTLEQILNALASPNRHPSAPADGILGYLASGWRDAISKELIHALLPSDSAEWGFRDRLLIFTAWGDKESAELSAREILAEPLRDWRYREEDTHILREWAEDAISTDVLQQWSLSDNATLSMTAISLMNDQNKISSPDQVALCARFNQQCQDADAPQDGLDAVVRRNEAWCISVYPALIAGIAS
ncbi:MAG: NACHT domain-containing protein [Gammaproteobacteria bacterium]|nr:NACHT domain-containing protein [Gammaproteobacteria bacterium]